MPVLRAAPSPPSVTHHSPEFPSLPLLHQGSLRSLVRWPTALAERRIALPTTCLAVLEQHRQEQERQRTAAGIRWRENGMIFTTRIGTPLDPSDVARRFTGLLDQAGIRRIRFHNLRHTCATLLLEQGVQPVTIKELLGHANIGITAQVYAHVRLRLQHDAINQLTDVLRDGDDPKAPPTATVAPG
ncbi:site-specific integrase [Streptomyces sp. NPDC047009]|uniref:tyrosine-type recombinase/integrase n=1 Tax=unclassified Streptomyces TaxID=2593676 RepID=UPI0033DA7F06